MNQNPPEAYFESRLANGEWETMRRHWEFAMGSIVTAYPFLSFEPKRKVIERKRVEIDDYDDGVVEHVVTDFCFADTDDDDLFDEDDDIDFDYVMELGNGVYSYSDTGQGEGMLHELRIELNEAGYRWAETLKALEAAEIISVSTEPHAIDVAPWHGRDV